MGYGHQSGTGVDKDLAQARAWYQRVLANPADDANAQRYKANARQRLEELGGGAK